ncbi:MAG: DUF3592 domain-containing protein, partial [Lentisphaeraceae bacterium]|nr:DUF3592 domain-containing protein [Lentisphaeraceae bacterium]
MKVKGQLFLLLFSIPFAAVGVFMAYMVFSTISEWQNAKSWIPTDATIEYIKLNRNSDGDGGTTYKVTGKYSYFFNENHYKSTQVTFSKSGDNIGSFQKDLHQRLKTSKTAICFVNPNDPTQAILDNTLRLEMVSFMSIFMFAFGGVGFGLGTYSLKQTLSKKRTVKVISQKFEVSHSSLPLIICLSLSSTILSLTSYIIIPELIQQVQSGRQSAYFGLIIPCVGTVSIIASIYIAIRHLSFGKSSILIEKGFGLIGGKLEGTLLSNCAPEKGFDVTLICSKWVKVGSKHTKTQLFIDSKNSKGTNLNTHNQVETKFSFIIPYELPSSDDSVIWNIQFKADMPGPDFSSSFDIPVHKTAESSSALSLDEALAQKDTLTLHHAIIKEGIQIRHIDDTLHLYFPMFRKLKTIIGLSAFWIVWMGLTIFFYQKGIWFFVAIWGLFDVFIFIGLIQ